MRTLRLLPLLLAACAPPLAYAQAAPELPRVVPSTAMPVTTRTLTVAGSLQAAIDSATLGDAIELPCGATYIGNFTLPVKSGTGWVVLRPSCPLPASGVRMTPAVADSLRLPVLVSPNAQAAIATQLGAHHYRLVGLAIAAAPSVPLNYGLVLLGSGGSSQNTTASIAHDLSLDRVYIHGPDSVSLKRCVGLNSATTAIVDSYISGCHAEGQDAQAIGGWNGPGPYLIQNNYLEGAAENVMFGGADPSVSGLVPSDITIRGNVITKPFAWRGSRWLVKNLIEVKNAQRVLIDGNLIERNWANGGSGAILTLKSVNQDGGCSWCVTQDITVRLNRVQSVGNGFVVAANPDNTFPVIPARRIAITDNLVTGLNDFPGDGRAFLLGGGAASLADVTIARNTVLGATLTGLAFTGQPISRLSVTDNVIGGGTYGIIGDLGGGVGAGSFARAAPDGTFARNVMILAGEYAQYTAQFPSGNRYPPSLAFTADFHLADTSLTAGAPVDSVLSAAAGAASGTIESPVPGPPPAPTPTIAALTLNELRAAITALTKVTGPAGRENLTIKHALEPVADYLKALLAASTTTPH